MYVEWDGREGGGRGGVQLGQSPLRGEKQANRENMKWVAQCVWKVGQFGCAARTDRLSRRRRGAAQFCV